MLSTQDIKVRLESRLASLESELQHVDNAIHELNKKIITGQQKLKALKKTCKMETKDSITKQINKLLFKHKTEVMSLQQEKVLLKEIESLNANIRTLQQYELMEESFTKMLEKRHDLVHNRKLKKDCVSEANMGLRKVMLSEYSGVSPKDLVSMTVSVHKNKVKNVMGRQLATMKRIEEQYHVIIEEQQDKAVVSANVEGKKASGKMVDAILVITGTGKSCEEAKYIIDQIARGTEETIHVGEDLGTVLKLKHPETKKTHADMIGTACEATILGIPKNHSVVLRGTPEAIAKAKDIIQSFDYCSRVMFVDKRDLPIVLGTRGEKIRSVETDHNVRINIKRETIADSVDKQSGNNTMHEVSILGSMEEDVKAAMESLYAIVAENELVEECIELPCTYLAPLLRNLQKGGLRDIEGTIRFIKLWVDDDDGSNGIIRCSGPKQKVADALPLVYEAAELAQSKTEVVKIPQHVMGIILGKKGAVINTIREAHPSVYILICIWLKSVLIYADDESSRMAACNAVMDIISSNHVECVQLGHDVAYMLKMKSTVSTRNAIVALNVHMDITGDDAGTIRLRGKPKAIEEAIKILLEFKSNNELEILKLSPENAGIIPSGFFNELKQNTGVTAVLIRDKLELHLVGNPGQLAEGRLYVHHFLYGDEVGGSVSFVPFEKEVVGYIIGKGGYRILKMQEEWGVSLEVVSLDKGRSRVRIRGDSKKVEEAKAKLTTIVENTSIVTTVDVSSMYYSGNDESAAGAPPITKNVVVEHSETIGNVFKLGATPDEDGKHIQLKGMARKVIGARDWLLALLRGRASIILPISGAFDDAEEAVFATEKLKEELNHTGDSSDAAVTIKLVSSEDSGGMYIAVEGETSAVQDAVRLSYKFLEHSFQGRFTSVFVPIGALDLSIGTPRAIKTAIEAGEHEVEIFADYLFNSVRIRGKNADSVSAAAAALDTVKAWMANNAVVTFEKWMAPLIIGRNGSSINDFSKKYSVVVRIDKESLSCFISDQRRHYRRAFHSGENRRDGPKSPTEHNGFGGLNTGCDNVVHMAARALRQVIDRMYKRNGCPLPDPQGIFSNEKGNEALKMVESTTGVSCTYRCVSNDVLVRGDKEAVLEARTALLEVMERGLDKQEQHSEEGSSSSESAVDPLSLSFPSLLSKKGDGDIPVSLTSPYSSAGVTLPVPLKPVRLDHRSAIVGKFVATEGGGGSTSSRTTSSHQEAASPAEYVKPTTHPSPISDFHNQTENLQPGDAAVIVDANHLAPEIQKQGSDCLRDRLYCKPTKTGTNPIISSKSNWQVLPSLPDSSNEVTVHGSKKANGIGNSISEKSGIHEEQGSLYFRSVSGLNVRLS